MRHTADPGPSVDSLRRTVLLRAHLLRRDSASAADAVLLEVLDAPVVTIHLLHRGERGASCVQHPPLPFGVPIVRLAGCWLTPYPRLCSETRSTGRISAAPSPSYPSSSPLWHLVRDVPRQLYVQSVGAALGRGILRRPARRDLRLLHRASARARVTWPGGMSLGRVIRIMTSLMCDDCYSTEPATSSGYTSTPAHSPTRRATDTAISGSCGRLWPSTRSSYSVGQEQRHAGSFMVCSS